MAVSVSLGHTTSHNAKSASGSGSVGAGAALKTVNAPAFRPRSSARIVVASGTSSCVSTTLAPAMAASALSTSAGASSPLAPATMMIWFSPAPSTTMCAMPDAALFVCATCAASTPKDAKLPSVDAPSESAPTLATMDTRLPRSAAATAWFAPLPPKSCSKREPSSVSPGLAKRGAQVTRSTLALPTTTTAMVARVAAVDNSCLACLQCRRDATTWSGAM